MFIVAVKFDGNADISTQEFSCCVSCYWWRGACSFPSFIILQGEDDSNFTEVVIPKVFIVPKQAERGFTAGAVLFDLGGNGAFWKKRV